jgi:predicted esterase
MARRAFLSGMAAFGVGAACSRGKAGERGGSGTSEPSAPAPGWSDVAFPASSDQPDGQLAAVLAPDGAKGWPLLVALHGRGEAGRGLAAGAHGWRDDYGLDAIRARLEKPPLASSDTADMLPAERLQSLNASLAASPWRGLLVACPYTPVPTGRDLASAAPFARFVAGALIAKVGELAGAAPPQVGIDGVSMGGRYALQLGLSSPEVYAAVGALQPAISEEEAGDFAELAAKARAKRPQVIRLVSSDGDPFLGPTKRLSEELAKRDVPHRLIVTSGPHDYAWNRGPGAVELLMFHERVLRGLPPA